LLSVELVLDPPVAVRRDDDDDDDSDDDDSQRSASFNAGAGIACCAPWSTGPGMRHLRWIAAERVTGA
jgi:hypothetical protein